MWRRRRCVAAAFPFAPLRWVTYQSPGTRNARRDQRPWQGKGRMQERTTRTPETSRKRAWRNVAQRSGTHGVDHTVMNTRLGMTCQGRRSGVAPRSPVDLLPAAQNSLWRLTDGKAAEAVALSGEAIHKPEAQLEAALEALSEAQAYYSHYNSYNTHQGRYTTAQRQRGQPAHVPLHTTTHVNKGGGATFADMDGSSSSSSVETAREGKHSDRRHADSRSDECAAPPTALQEEDAAAMATLLQWVTWSASMVPQGAFVAHHPAIRRALLYPEGPLLLDTETTSTTATEGRGGFSTSKSLHDSLARRAAVGYVELLVRHAQHPTDAREWARLCTALTLAAAPVSPLASGDAPTNSRDSASFLAQLPLFPSGLQAAPDTPRLSRDELQLLARTLTWRQADAILLWATQFAPETVGDSCGAAGRCHVSSQDVLYALTRRVQATGHREEEDGEEEEGMHEWGEAVGDGEGGTRALSSGPHTAFGRVRRVAELAVQWEQARAAERADRRLARACHLDRTAENTIAVKGKKVVLSVSASPHRSTDVGERSHKASSMPDPKPFNEWLLRGEWHRVLSDMLRYAQRYNQHRHQGSDRKEVPSCAAFAELDKLIHKALSKEGKEVEEGTGVTRSPLSELTQFFSLTAATGADDCEPRLPVPLFASPKHVLQYRLPSELAAAPVSEAELQLLADALRRRHTTCAAEGTPTSAVLAAVEELVDGLPVPPTAPSDDGTTHTTTTTTPVDFRTVMKDILCDLGHKEQAAGRRTVAPPALVVDLRRRLWLLSQLPPHVPKALVRFGHKATTTAAGSPPFILRSPQRELLPWLLVSLLALVVEAALAREEVGSWLEDVAGTVRTVLSPTLFAVAPDYAAFHEFTCEALLHLGTAAAELAVEAHVACGHRARDGSVRDEAAAVARAERVVFVFAKTVLKPPPAVLPPSREAPDMTSKVYQVENYLASLYLEALVQLAPTMRDYVEAQRELGASEVVLAPEAAATITTAILLRLAPTVAAAGSSYTDAFLQELAVAVAPPHGLLPFAVPVDKAHAVAAYFKGIHHPCYLDAPDMTLRKETKEGGEGVAQGRWQGPEAFLVGRSLRLVSRHPATCADAFLRSTADTRAEGLVQAVPRLAWRFCAVDVKKCLAFFAEKIVQQQQQQQDRKARDVCAVVAEGLPYGLCAVYKPAGVTTTLHASYDSLVVFLSHALPWGSGSSNERRTGVTVPPCNVQEALQAACTPVRHQHGLVNRIDVGTSGLVLVATDACGLHRGRLNTLAHRRATKTYQALIQHVPAPRGPPQGKAGRGSRGGGGGAGDMESFFDSTMSSASRASSSSARYGKPRLWFLPLEGVVNGAIAAHGSDAEAILGSSADLPAGKSVSALDRRPALTFFRVLAHFPKHGVSHVELRLHSGRRHQIRQHMAMVQHPLLGDERYHPEESRSTAPGVRRSPRTAQELLTRAALHASALTIVNVPESLREVVPGEEGQTAVVECPLPADMRQALQWLRRGEREAGRRRRTEEKGPS